MIMEKLTARTDDWVSLCISLLMAVMLTFFLFFIDEGYYNFDWMNRGANWIGFAIYSIVLFVGQIVIKLLLFKNNNSWLSYSLIVLLGVLISLFVVFRLVF